MTDQNKAELVAEQMSNGLNVKKIWGGIVRSVAEFGAKGGDNDDTAAVQAAFDSGENLIFNDNYRVTSVILRSVEQMIDFNGYSLIGIAATSTEAVLEITGRHMSLYNVSVDGNFNTNYTSVVRWHSLTSGNPSQYNKIYGMKIRKGIVGLVYGAPIGQVAVDAPHSENTVFGLTYRAVEQCFIGNQLNGFITLVSPILDCNPYEWATVPGNPFNSTNAVCFNNPQNNLVILGGEILKTFTQLGYAIKGHMFKTIGTVYELACSQALITGDATIQGVSDGYMSADSVSAFVIDTGAEGTLKLIDNEHRRGTGVSAYSGAWFIDGTNAPNYRVIVDKCTMYEWKPEFMTRGCDLSLAHTYFHTDKSIYTTQNPNLLKVEPDGMDVPTAGFTTGEKANWRIVNNFGGNPFYIKKVADSDLPVGMKSAIEIKGSGGSTDVFSHFSIVPSTEKIVLKLFYKALTVASGGNIVVKMDYFSEDRALISQDTIVLLAAVGNWQSASAVITPPTNTAYVRVNINMLLDTLARFCGIKLCFLDKNLTTEYRDKIITRSAAPISGEWWQNEVVYSDNAAAGGYVGWICTATGSPGTWKQFGAILA